MKTPVTFWREMSASGVQPRRQSPLSAWPPNIFGGDDPELSAVALWEKELEGRVLF
jgi:hypothetical protein